MEVSHRLYAPSVTHGKAFLMALGVSVLLQSIERFISPSEITDPVLVMAVGAAGVGSNIIMLLILGGKRSSSGLDARRLSN